PAASVLTGINRTECIEDIVMRRGVGSRSHIGYDETIYAIGIRQREKHRRFSAHRVPQYVGGCEAMVIHEVPQILDHDLITELVAVWGTSVVPQVDGVDFKVLPEPPAADGVPVAPRAEQSVEHDQGVSLPV